MIKEHKLLPCPFCGLIPSLHNSYSKWIVIHECDYIDSVGDYGRKIEVIKKWNTRQDENNTERESNIKDS